MKRRRDGTMRLILFRASWHEHVVVVGDEEAEGGCAVCDGDGLEDGVANGLLLGCGGWGCEGAGCGFGGALEEFGLLLAVLFEEGREVGGAIVGGGRTIEGDAANGGGVW